MSHSIFIQCLTNKLSLCVNFRCSLLEYACFLNYFDNWTSIRNCNNNPNSSLIFLKSKSMLWTVAFVTFLLWVHNLWRNAWLSYRWHVQDLVRFFENLNFRNCQALHFKCCTENTPSLLRSAQRVRFYTFKSKLQPSLASVSVGFACFDPLVCFATRARLFNDGSSITLLTTSC